MTCSGNTTECLDRKNVVKLLQWGVCSSDNSLFFSPLQVDDVPTIVLNKYQIYTEIMSILVRKFCLPACCIPNDNIFFLSRFDSCSGPGPPHCRASDSTLRHTIIGRTPLDEWSARRRDLYRKTHKHSQEKNIHAPCGIRTRNPSRRDALDRHLRSRRHRDRQWFYLLFCVKTMFLFFLRTDYYFECWRIRFQDDIKLNSTELRQ